MQSYRKKLLLWMTTFALIMACVPAAATPVPTLDPNAINILIVQTAGAASTQTAAAAPVFTSTATFTATPRSTFTLEPTYTPVGVLIFPTGTPIAREQYFRVKHDTQLAEYNNRSRTAAPDWPTDIWGLQTPEVFPMSVAQKDASGTNRTTMTGAWDTYIDKLNAHDEKKINYIKSDNTALFNGNGFPQMESVTMGGNIITIDKIENGWGRVHTLDYGNPGDLGEISYITRPDLIHKFVVVGWKRSSKTTYWVNPPHGDLYWPLVSSREVWMPLEWLEPFPQLPLVVTANTTQEIKVNPAKDSPSSGSKLTEGTSARVVKYYPSASDVWGRLANGGWIALLTHEKGAVKYPTSWQMETMPPLP